METVERVCRCGFQSLSLLFVFYCLHYFCDYKYNNCNSNSSKNKLKSSDNKKREGKTRKRQQFNDHADEARSFLAEEETSSIPS